MNNDYGKVYKEVLVILKSLSEEDFSKIPKEEIEFYEKNSDKDYDFKIDTNNPLGEQNMSRMANSILISIYMDYFATDEQKRLVKDILRLNRQKEENEKSRSYIKDNGV